MIFCLLFFFPDWNWDPVILDQWNDLPTADIIRWFAQSLPGKHLGPPRSLVQIIAIGFAQSEVALQQQVHALLVDPPAVVQWCRDLWLERQKVVLDKYTRTTLLVHKKVDGLFLLLAVRKYGCYVSLVHMDGVWTSHRDGNMHKADIMIAQTTDGFYEIL